MLLLIDHQDQGQVKVQIKNKLCYQLDLLHLQTKHVWVNNSQKLPYMKETTQ